MRDGHGGLLRWKAAADARKRRRGRRLACSVAPLLTAARIAALPRRRRRAARYARRHAHSCQSTAAGRRRASARLLDRRGVRHLRAARLRRRRPTRGAIDGEIEADQLATLQLSRVTATAQHRAAHAGQDRARHRGLLPGQHPDRRAAAWSSQDGRVARARARRLRALRQHAALRADVRRPTSSRYVLQAARADAAHRAARHARRLTARTVSRRPRRRPPDDRHDPARWPPTSRRWSRRRPRRWPTAWSTSWSPGCRSLPAARPPPVSQLTALPSRADQGLRARAAARSASFGVAQIARASAPVAEHDAPRLRRRAVLAHRLDLDAAARRAPSATSATRRCAARTISEIAFGWGFNDAAHFSRAFRARFGCSPRDVRH